MSDTLPPVPPSTPQAANAASDSSSPGAGSPAAQQLLQTLSHAKRHGAGFVGRFKQIDFKKEIWPLDSDSAKKLAGQPAFWAVTLLAALAGLLTASVLHGMYDWLWDIQITLPAVVTVISFMVLKLYVLQGTAGITPTIPPGRRISPWR